MGMARVDGSNVADVFSKLKLADADFSSLAPSSTWLNTFKACDCPWVSKEVLDSNWPPLERPTWKELHDRDSVKIPPPRSRWSYLFNTSIE